MKVRYGVVAVVALAAAYPASSWYMGQRVEHYLDGQYQKLAEYPSLKLVDRKMERGIFSSTETATFEFFLPRRTAAKQVSANTEKERVIRFTTRSIYKHGPFPGLSQVAAARAHTEVTFDGQSPVLAKLYGDKAPLTIDTVLDFSGASHQEVKSPAVDAVVGKQAHVRWGALQMTNDIQPDSAAYKISGSLPFVKIDSADGRNTLDVGTIKLSGEQRRLFEDNPSLYIGPVEMTVAKLDARAPDGKTLAAEGLRIAGDVAEHDAFLDISVSYGFQSLNVAGQNIGPSRLDLGLRHLDAKSLSDFHRAYMKLASDPDFPPKGGKIDPAVFKTLQQPLTVIFQKSPEFGIDQLELDLPAGKISGKLSARLPGDKVGNLEEATADPTVLKRTLAMVETDAELAVPEALLRSVLGEARAPMLDQLLEVGYLKRQGEHLATKLKYADGKIVVNGKPVDPRMFGRPPQAE